VFYLKINDMETYNERMKSTVSNPSGQLVYFTAQSPRLSATNPVFEFDMSKRDAAKCSNHLQDFGTRSAGGTITVGCPAVSSVQTTSRITLTINTPPAYEVRAGNGCVRGTALSVQAGASSCNIVLTGPGALAVAKRLAAETKRAKASVHWTVERGNGKRDDLIQIVADTGLAAAQTERESARLAAGSLASAAGTWGDEDFSDWEKP
jgi:hypothetical protein